MDGEFIIELKEGADIIKAKTDIKDFDCSIIRNNNSSITVITDEINIKSIKDLKYVNNIKGCSNE